MPNIDELVKIAEERMPAHLRAGYAPEAPAKKVEEDLKKAGETEDKDLQEEEEKEEEKEEEEENE